MDTIIMIMLVSSGIVWLIRRLDRVKEMTARLELDTTPNIMMRFVAQASSREEYDALAAEWERIKLAKLQRLSRLSGICTRLQWLLLPQVVITGLAAAKIIPIRTGLIVGGTVLFFLTAAFLYLQFAYRRVMDV